jgi:exodeoxyribonuclease VII small subunit
MEQPLDAASAADALSFEEAYRELEKTVESLDAARGDLTLEKAIALYDWGMQLARRCSQAHAELQVQQLAVLDRQRPGDAPQLPEQLC